MTLPVPRPNLSQNQQNSRSGDENRGVGQDFVSQRIKQQVRRGVPRPLPKGSGTGDSQPVTHPSLREPPTRDKTTFIVAGHPVTQGSKRAYVAAGQAHLVETGGARHKLWRHAINDEARRTWNHTPLTGPVTVELVFAIQPPQSLTRARRAAGPVGARSGDIDKLTRAVLDGLTGVTYLDDAQVIDLHVTKTWADPTRGPGVTITIGAAP